MTVDIKTLWESFFEHEMARTNTCPNTASALKPLLKRAFLAGVAGVAYKVDISGAGFSVDNIQEECREADFDFLTKSQIDSLSESGSTGFSA